MLCCCQVTSSTADAVHQLISQHQQQQATLQSQLQLTAALLHDDPPPRQWGLSLHVESSNYFITEGSEPSTGAVVAPRAAALGLGVDVPRYLRWCEGPVQLQQMSLTQLEDQIMMVWQVRKHEFRTSLMRRWWVAKAAEVPGSVRTITCQVICV